MNLILLPLRQNLHWKPPGILPKQGRGVTWVYIKYSLLKALYVHWMYKLGTAPTQLVMNCLETFMAFFFNPIPVFISTISFLRFCGCCNGCCVPRCWITLERVDLFLQKNKIKCKWQALLCFVKFNRQLDQYFFRIDAELPGTYCVFYVCNLIILCLLR